MRWKNKIRKDLKTLSISTNCKKQASDRYAWRDECLTESDGPSSHISKEKEGRSFRAGMN